MARLARVVVAGVAHHVTPLLERMKDWREYLMEPLEAKQEELWRHHERTGRPLGEAAFLDRIYCKPTSKSAT